MRVVPRFAIVHDHLHLVGHLIRVAGVPSGVHLVPVLAAHERHVVLAHEVMCLHARLGRPSVRVCVRFSGKLGGCVFRRDVVLVGEAEIPID